MPMLSCSSVFFRFGFFTDLSINQKETQIVSESAFELLFQRLTHAVMKSRPSIDVVVAMLR